jgi:hypothetical protein
MAFGTGFDPKVSQRPPRGPQRGRHFRLLMILLVLLLAGGILFERWLFGWRFSGSTTPRPQVQQTRAVEPDFQLPEPRVELAAVPAIPRPEPVTTPAPAPARQAPAREPPRPPKMPTQIAFSVQAPEPPALAWFQDGRRPMLARGCALRPGATVIRAVLETTLRSEVAGQAIAQVSEDVYDADQVGRLLIPAGTKVVGVYKRSGGLDFQRRRLDLVWTEMTLPDGRQLALADASGMDAAGSMGVGGEVRTRWGELLATAALLTVFDAVQRSTVTNDTGLLDSAQAAASRQGGQLGREVTRKVLSWEPDITVPGGTPIIIAPQKTVQVC